MGTQWYDTDVFQAVLMDNHHTLLTLYSQPRKENINACKDAKTTCRTLFRAAGSHLTLGQPRGERPLLCELSQATRSAQRHDARTLRAAG